MATGTLVNLPVEDLGKSKEFFSRLGFTFEPRFTDGTAACMIVTRDVRVMLLTKTKFRSSTPKTVCTHADIGA